MTSIRREKLKVTFDKYEDANNNNNKPKRLKDCGGCRIFSFGTEGRSRKAMRTFSEESTTKKTALKLVEDANKLTDPLAKLTAFKIFHKNNIHLTVYCTRAKNLTHHQIQWALKLTKDNMQNLYEASDWGWNEKAKRQEMTHPSAWYLIVQTLLDRKPVGFVHFRFDLDFDIPVLYCYEIQLEEFIRRSGLGRYLMLTLELLARQTQMKKVMLTVFKHNEIGRDFFIKKLRYEVDETSPDCETATYEILSKKVPNKLEIHLRKSEDTVKFEAYTKVEESSKLKEVINQEETFRDVINEDKTSTDVNNMDETSADGNNEGKTLRNVNNQTKSLENASIQEAALVNDNNQEEALGDDDNQEEALRDNDNQEEMLGDFNNQKEMTKTEEINLEKINKIEDISKSDERILVESAVQQ